jgi:hypothetical protein
LKVEEKRKMKTITTSSPVLFLVFRRPEPTARVFQAIRAARPARLYIAADGARGDKPGEMELCAAVREIVAAVDWPCEVKTLFRDANLGCKIAVSSAIDWFFASEEQGIILEDDCLPSPSFFAYCDALLHHHKDDERVMSICGSNAINVPAVGAESYFYSRHCRVWGWATWRRAWQHYDVTMGDWPEFRVQRGLQHWSSDEYEFESYWTDILDRTFAGEIDTWDYQWMFACWAHGGLACRPYQNLISNLGFGEDATHTFDSEHPNANAARHDLSLPIVHPGRIFRNLYADQVTQRTQFSKRLERWELRKRAVRKVRYMLQLQHRKRIGP